ncbi:O-antigen ligase family protein [Porticoccaceae bacterium]|nr:O-antigen ligase family protein [Porticoccaceae bacterium]
MNHNFLAKIILALLSIFLLIDAINGLFVLSFGIDTQLSVLYKALILMLLLIYLSLHNVKALMVISGLYFTLLLGEALAIVMLRSSAAYVGFVVQHAVKVITPLVLFFFLLDRYKRDGQLYLKLERVMFINCGIFLANIFLGWFGVGFSTYGGGVSATSIGVKGFFYAGNEISAMMIVFAGFYLARSYTQSKLRFIFVAVMWLCVGVLISTKTAILSVIILVFAIPMVLEGRRIFQFNNTPSLVFYTLLVAVALQGLLIYQAFEGTLLFNKLSFFLAKGGWVGLILSGRDQFVTVMWDYFIAAESVSSMLIGNGVSYYADHIKYSSEMDLPDMFFWHGIVGVMITLGIFMMMTFYSAANFFKQLYPYARVVFLINVLLLIISNLSGHVFTSGMLAFLWPCFAIMAKYSPPKAASG